MPTLDAIRSAGEAEIEAILERSDDYTRRVLRDALRRYGHPRNIPESVWVDVEQHRERQTALALYFLMLAADDWTTDELSSQGLKTRRMSPERLAGYSVDAARRAQRMSQQTTQTLRDRLGRKIEDQQLSVEESPVGELDLGDIDKALDDVLNKKSRETTATNETTGAMSQGQRGAGKRHEPGAGSSVQIDLVWQTESDDRVCPRCSPLDGTTEEIWGKVFPEGPGEEAHPNCRCSLRPVVRALAIQESDRGRWVTLDNGVHVKIDNDGSIADAIKKLGDGKVDAKKRYDRQELERLGDKDLADVAKNSENERTKRLAAKIAKERAAKDAPPDPESERMAAAARDDREAKERPLRQAIQSGRDTISAAEMPASERMKANAYIAQMESPGEVKRYADAVASWGHADPQLSAIEASVEELKKRGVKVSRRGRNSSHYGVLADGRTIRVADHLGKEPHDIEITFDSPPTKDTAVKIFNAAIDGL